MSNKLKTITIEDIRSWQPCYDPSRHLPENWQGTAIDILDHATIPPEDKMWVVLRTQLVSEKLVRLFAVWCARQVVKPDADPRTLFALEFMEAYADWYWLIDDADYRVMWDAERSAAWSAAGSAAEYAARFAACSAAEYAARSAARSAARFAACSAAEYAARSAAGSAAVSAAEYAAAVGSAAWSAAEYAAAAAVRFAARFAAGSAAVSAQVAKLREMVLAGVETGDTDVEPCARTPST